MEIDLHGYHPAEIVLDGILGEILEQTLDEHDRARIWPAQGEPLCVAGPILDFNFTGALAMNEDRSAHLP